jgi:hypothetical protein
MKGFYSVNILLAEGMNPKGRSFLGRIKLTETRDFWTQIWRQSGCPINKHFHKQALVWTLINEQTGDLKTLNYSKQTR